MCDMNHVAWIALAVSLASACIAGLASWTSRERLRLDLYNRRFDVYCRTLDFYHALLGWKPTELEKTTTSLQNSPELRTAQTAFIKAKNEAQFLFDDASGIKEELKQIHTDSIAIIWHLRDNLPKLLGRPEFVSANEQCNECQKRFDGAIPSLEKKMSEYLDFHTLRAWNFFG